MFGSAIVYISGLLHPVCRKICIVRHWIFREKTIVQPCLLTMFWRTLRLVLSICALFCALLRFCASDVYLYICPAAKIRSSAFYELDHIMSIRSFFGLTEVVDAPNRGRIGEKLRFSGEEQG